LPGVSHDLAAAWRDTSPGVLRARALDQARMVAGDRRQTRQRAATEICEAPAMALAELQQTRRANEMSGVDVFRLIMVRQRDAQARGVLNIWTVFDRPADHPHGYIARRFEVDQPTADAFEGDIEAIRDAFTRCGLYRIKRQDADHPSVVESWL
jgi:hypothetical protein